MKRVTTAKVVMFTLMVLLLVSIPLLGACAAPAPAPAPEKKIPILLAGPPIQWGEYAVQAAINDVVNRTINLDVTAFARELLMLTRRPLLYHLPSQVPS